MDESLCPRTGLPLRLCECWEVVPMDKELTVDQREYYRQRAERREADEEPQRVTPRRRWRRRYKQT